MTGGQQIKDHLELDSLLRQDPELLREFVDNPQGVLDRIGVGASALDCPDAAHDAEERAKAAAVAAKSLEDLSPVEAVPRLAALARERLGQDVVVTKIPFGIQFSEPVRMEGDLALTATGTIGGTFRISIKPDHDG